MNTQRLIDTFFELVSIDSPSHGERQMCDHLKKILTDLGLELYEDNAGDILGGNCGNLYGFLPGDESLSPLLFSAHMDTVEPALGKKAVLHSDGKITSAGNTVLGADDLAGVAAILEALRTIKEQKLTHRPIEILFSVTEEKYCIGAGAFDFSRIKSTEGYVLDLIGAVGTVANKAPTVISFTVTITGKAAHAGFAPETGIHAIAVAAKAIENTSMGNVDRETTCNIGLIDGGTALNIVPDCCAVKGEIRSYSHDKALKQMQMVSANFTDAANKFSAQVQIETEIPIEAYEIPADHPVAGRFKQTCDELGLPFSLTSTFGGSDNNHFAKNGIAGLVIANAMNACHSCDEFSSVSELENITRLTTQLMTSKL